VEPKTSAAARDIPYAKTSMRAALALEDYFDRYDQFEASRVAVNRRGDDDGGVGRLRRRGRDLPARPPSDGGLPHG